MRRTRNLISVAAALVSEPHGRHWGYDLSKRSGVRAGAMYPMLSKFLEQGWLIDGWEDPTRIAGRPPRRYYELTDVGCRELGAIVALAEPTAATLRPRSI